MDISGQEAAAGVKNLKRIDLFKQLDAGGHMDRNLKCPCGSGKKFKKCCEPEWKGLKKMAEKQQQVAKMTQAEIIEANQKTLLLAYKANEKVRKLKLKFYEDQLVLANETFDKLQELPDTADNKEEMDNLRRSISEIKSSIKDCNEPIDIAERAVLEALCSSAGE